MSIDDSRHQAVLTRRTAMAGAVGAALPRQARAETPALRCGGAGSSLAMLQLLGAEWAATDPDAVPLTTPARSLGSGGGLAALIAGRLDLAITARELTDGEAANQLTVLPYARSPLVFATRRGLTAGPFAIGEIERMLLGERTNWPDGTPVLVVRRPATDGTVRTAASFSPTMAETLAALRRRPGVPLASTDIDNADMLEARLGSLGTIVLGQLVTERRRLIPLVLQGLDASLPAVREGAYKPTVTLAMVLPPAPSLAAFRFVEFVRSAPPAQSLLGAMGHVPWRA